MAQVQESGSASGEARGGRRLGPATMALTMDQDFPYVVRVNVEIAELQALCDKAEAIGEPSGVKMVELNEALFFCFKLPLQAVAFEVHCERNRIPHHRDPHPSDWSD
jgi:hypothetical protein